MTDSWPCLTFDVAAFCSVLDLCCPDGLRPIADSFSVSARWSRGSCDLYRISAHTGRYGPPSL